MPLNVVNEETLLFNSRFESGNLKCVYREKPVTKTNINTNIVTVNNNIYRLELSNDTNNETTTQWYYFSCKNVRKGLTVTFNISNLHKDDSCYSEGMKPFVFSAKRYENTQERWHRAGFNIKYFKNSYQGKCRIKALDKVYLESMTGQADSGTKEEPSKKTTTGTEVLENILQDQNQDPLNIMRGASFHQANPKYRSLNSLQFDYTFDYDDDIVFFSHFAPYTYDDL